VGGAGLGEGIRRAVADDLGAEPDGRYPGGGEPLDPRRDVVVARPLRAGRQQGVAGGEERRRVGEVARVHPRPRAFARRVIGPDEAQLQLAAREQSVEGDGHGRSFDSGVCGNPSRVLYAVSSTERLAVQDVYATRGRRALR
jgi:hypothetical protein